MGQAILYWQTRTIEMMYMEVGKALREASVPPHLGQHPTDWLLFLCPGKRELYESHIDVLDDPPPGSLAEIFRRTMRQMIYVHSSTSTIPMEMCTCSECLSGLSILGLGRRGSGSQEHWTVLQGLRKCAGTTGRAIILRSTVFLKSSFLLASFYFIQFKWNRMGI